MEARLECDWLAELNKALLKLERLGCATWTDGCHRSIAIPTTISVPKVATSLLLKATEVVRQLRAWPGDSDLVVMVAPHDGAAASPQLEVRAHELCLLSGLDTFTRAPKARTGTQPTLAHSRNSAVADLLHFFETNGLGAPPVPFELATSLKQIGARCWSSREPPWWPYGVEEYIAEAVRGSPADYLLLAHTGHGVNSHAIHYFLVRDCLTLFVQVGWGGAYMDAATSAANVARALKCAGRLVKAADLARPGSGRLLVAAREFHGSWWVPPKRQIPDKPDQGLWAFAPHIMDPEYSGARGVIRVIEEANAWVIRDDDLRTGRPRENR